MKKLSALILSIVLVLSLSACTAVGGNGRQNSTGNADSGMSSNNGSVNSSAGTTEATITADEALGIALADAGVNKADIYDVSNELDRENGTLVYEVDFEAGSKEYSYDINAETGEIAHREKEAEFLGD